MECDFGETDGCAGVVGAEGGYEYGRNQCFEYSDVIVDDYVTAGNVIGMTKFYLTGTKILAYEREPMFLVYTRRNSDFSPTQVGSEEIINREKKFVRIQSSEYLHRLVIKLLCFTHFYRM